MSVSPRTSAATCAALLAALALPAAASAAIVIVKPEIRATFPGQPTAAAYMTVRNTGASADRLVAVECGCAAGVMAHRTETSGGVARMVMEGEVEIPAHGQVAFAPNGRHLMLTGLKAALPAGSRTPMTLTFARAGKVRATFVARTDPAAAPPARPSNHTH